MILKVIFLYIQCFMLNKLNHYRISIKSLDAHPIIGTKEKNVRTIRLHYCLGNLGLIDHLCLW